MRHTRLSLGKACSNARESANAGRRARTAGGEAKGLAGREASARLSRWRVDGATRQGDEDADDPRSRRLRPQQENREGEREVLGAVAEHVEGGRRQHLHQHPPRQPVTRLGGTGCGPDVRQRGAGLTSRHAVPDMEIPKPRTHDRRTTAAPRAGSAAISLHRRTRSSGYASKAVHLGFDLFLSTEQRPDGGGADVKSWAESSRQAAAATMSGVARTLLRKVFSHAFMFGCWLNEYLMYTLLNTMAVPYAAPQRYPSALYDRSFEA